MPKRLQLTVSISLLTFIKILLLSYSARRQTDKLTNNITTYNEVAGDKNQQEFVVEEALV